MTTQVYIITRDGKTYTKDGTNFIKDMLKNKFNVQNDLTFFSGISYNDPRVLQNALTEKPDSYVILSTKDDTIAISNDANLKICENIKESIDRNENRTSWEILMISCNKETY